MKPKRADQLRFCFRMCKKDTFSNHAAIMKLSMSWIYANYSKQPVELYILNAKNLAPPILSTFFWIKIDDFKIQRSLVFMPVQKTIVAEKIKCVGNHAYIFGRKI